MGLNKNPKKQPEDTTYATILSDGMIHVAVPEGIEGAELRLYATDDDKKKGPDVKTGKKWEHIYTDLSGMIDKVQFHEGEYGINILVVVTDDEESKPVTLAISTESNFGEDLMKKLPNIDTKKPVTFAPYSFDNDKGKKTRGISITQENKKGEKVKILSNYYDTEAKKVTNGYPAAPKPKPGKKIPKSEWRQYFASAREFLIEDLRENHGVTDKTPEGESEEDMKARHKSNKEFDGK